MDKQITFRVTKDMLIKATYTIIEHNRYQFKHHNFEMKNPAKKEIMSEVVTMLSEYGSYGFQSSVYNFDGLNQDYVKLAEELVTKYYPDVTNDDKKN